MTTDKIHGLVVEMQSQTKPSQSTRAGRVVLVAKGDGEWVTAWQGHGDSEWTWGHYFHDRLLAVADFNVRAERGC